MLYSKLIKYVSAAMLVKVFHEVKRYDFKSVFMAFELVNDRDKVFPCEVLSRDAAFLLQFVSNQDLRRGNVGNVAVSVDKKHVIHVINKR